MVSLDLLERIEIYKGLNDKQLGKIQPFCEEVSFRRGDRLFAEGEVADHLWHVHDGQVDLRFELPGLRASTEDNTVSSVSAYPKEARTLGWSCFVPPYKYRLSAYCVSRSTSLVRIPKKDIQSVFEGDKDIGFSVTSYLLQVVGYRFHQFQDEVARHMGHGVLNRW
ncbi:MAG: cyclic nucleotide-binding domain-containing protein [Thermodesulfobacteriota bacterium]